VNIEKEDIIHGVYSRKKDDFLIGKNMYKGNKRFINYLNA
jgi:hypothetical protein